MFQGREDTECVDPLVLPESCSHDSILCSAVGDLMWSQRSQIVLGTYGKVRGGSSGNCLVKHAHRYRTMMWLLSNGYY